MTLPQVACQVVLAVVFAVSAVTKIRSVAALRAFASSLTAVPSGSRMTVAVGVAGAEAAVPFLMLVPPLGLALSGLLLAGFTAVIVASMRAGVRTPCRCFGGSATPLGPVHVTRNALLLLVVVTGLIALVRPGGQAPLEGLAVAASAGLVGAVLLIVLDDIVDLVKGKA
ncbi:MauE/DoxX family redox-associated membrane protein [Nonomuraea sp. NPDC048826]|uniref:MauE/DoxX family redox-associated membrane protein n=1 Tax=Nonomuraea sp. NPDC048826 TaxID=3364347 RepID=UPI003710DA9E